MTTPNLTNPFPAQQRSPITPAHLLILLYHPPHKTVDKIIVCSGLANLFVRPRGHERQLNSWMVSRLLWNAQAAKAILFPC
jgi:hypothetical protein